MLFKKKQSCDDERRSHEEDICTDPDGSWTGVPVQEEEEPVQDVDDL